MISFCFFTRKLCANLEKNAFIFFIPYSLFSIMLPVDAVQAKVQKPWNHYFGALRNQEIL